MSIENILTVWTNYNYTSYKNKDYRDLDLYILRKRDKYSCIVCYLEGLFLIDY